MAAVVDVEVRCKLHKLWQSEVWRGLGPWLEMQSSQGRRGTDPGA